LKKSLVLLFLCLVAETTNSAEFALTLPTPIRVIDGDTLSIVLDNIPAPINKISIRLLGVDTPELKGKCVREKELALAAKRFTVQFVKNNPVLIATKLKWDKYGGRIDGIVSTPTGDSLADLLIVQGLATAYSGKGAKTDWCSPIK
jgi:endonuclease YncB( thermonuclease family)